MDRKTAPMEMDHLKLLLKEFFDQAKGAPATKNSGTFSNENVLANRGFMNLHELRTR